MHIQRALFLLCGLSVILAPVGLCERIYPPFYAADVHSSTHGQGSSGGAAYASGCILLYATVSEVGDLAVATATVGTVINVQTASEVVVWMRISHTSGSAALTWLGQMSEVVATPYYSEQDGPPHPGPVHHLSGTPLADAAAHYLEALKQLPREDGVALSPAAWVAADALSEAQDEQERALAWGAILAEGAREGCLQHLIDVLEHLGYLHYEEIRLTFSATTAGDHAVGLAVEVSASPLRPAEELSWLLGRVDWIDVEVTEVQD